MGITVSHVKCGFLAFLLLTIAFLGTCKADDPTYWQDVRPALRRHCVSCHNIRKVSEIEVSGGLALDTFASLKKGTKHPVFVPGKSGDSLIYKLLVTQDDNIRMPLASRPVPADVAELVRRWIDSGAREGTKTEDDELISTAPARTRKLDVIFPTAAVPPSGLFGPAPPAPLALSARIGPLAPVTAVAFSPDGKLLAIGSYSLVTIWDLTTCKPARTLTNVLGVVNDIKFSPDGTVLAVGGGQPSAKGDLRLYQTTDWKLLASLGGHDDVVFQVDFAPDGKRLASASFDKTVRVWDTATAKTVLTLTGHSDFVYTVAFSPDGKRIASGSKDRTVKLADAETGKSLFTFGGMEQDVLAVAYSRDGKSIVSSGFETGLYWWNPQNGERIRTQGGHGVAVHEICFSKDGKLVVSAGADRTVRTWNGTTGAAEKTISVGSIVYACAISPDSTKIATGSFDGIARLWDTATSRQLVSLLSLPAQADESRWLALTPEGFARASPAFAAQVTWTMKGAAVPSDTAWKALGDPEAVARAARGETIKPPTFEKKGEPSK
jgi:DNA-binding beta-propeller fold protein YncE